MELKDWSALALALSAGASLLAFCGGATWFVLRAVFPSRREHRDLESRVGRIENRTDQIAAAVDRLPNHKDMAEIKDRIAVVDGSIVGLMAAFDGMRGQLAGLERSLALLLDHHLEERR